MIDRLEHRSDALAGPLREREALEATFLYISVGLGQRAWRLWQVIGLGIHEARILQSIAASAQWLDDAVAERLMPARERLGNYVFRVQRASAIFDG